MLSNPVIENMMNRKSIRKYKKQMPSDDVIETIVRAGQQAPFSAQLYSILLSRGKKKYPWGAPIMFTICVDLYKMKIIMTKRDWMMITNDLTMLLFGIQDAILVAQNMVTAAESLGLGSCFIGGSPYRAEKIAEEFKLPEKVLPLVDLVIGYPDENPPPRPRYPMEFTLFEDVYPDFSDKTIEKAMKRMDEGYMRQNYYRKGNFMIELETDREETFDFDSYGWTEHISRKWGQWYPSPGSMLEQLAKRGFNIIDDKK